MFQLGKAIDQWCDELRATRHTSETEIIELRDHLESDIERLRWEEGRTDEEAFRLAIDKLGSVEEIAGEFFKNDYFERLRNTPWQLKLVAGLYMLSGVRIIIAPTLGIPNNGSEFDFEPILWAVAYLEGAFLITIGIQLLRLKHTWLMLGILWCWLGIVFGGLALFAGIMETVVNGAAAQGQTIWQALLKNELALVLAVSVLTSVLKLCILKSRKVVKLFDSEDGRLRKEVG